MKNEFLSALQEFETGGGRKGKFFSLPELEKQGIGPVSRLPVSIRILLESVLRNCDGRKITREDVIRVANWPPRTAGAGEIPFLVARILLQDFTGIPLLVDLAAMRSAVAGMNGDPRLVEPLVPVDLVIDHSVQVDFWSRPDALRLNMEIEIARNRARYEFLKWGRQAFQGFQVVPPGMGICHQINLEYLAKGVYEKDGVYFPDTLIGTDSHTTMINGLGIVGWGVGGIEAEAGMLGQPIYLLMPEVLGVRMSGSLREGVTATDLVLHVAEKLRQVGVVGKFVEFFGEGAVSLSVPDRATIGNMSPEYGATISFFPVDEKTVEYYQATGRTEERVTLIRNYFQAQDLFGIPHEGQIDYSQILEMDLSQVNPSVSGPRRPQDRIDLPKIKERFHHLLQRQPKENGYGKSEEEINKRIPLRIHHPTFSALHGGGRQSAEPVPGGSVEESENNNTSVWTELEMMNNRPTPDPVRDVPSGEPMDLDAYLGHGDVLIASITSCTNTSNPSVMLAAGIVAKKAVEKGLKVPPHVKTSLGPGSRAVTEYYRKTGLQKYLDQLGFHHVGYGCITCIGNSGPLDPAIEAAVLSHDLAGVSVLSGNRNFEARVHQSIKANFLMSPPLVIAFALAGRIGIDMESEPIGQGADGEKIFLRDLWPTAEELNDMIKASHDPETYQRLYENVAGENPLWEEIASPSGLLYRWDDASTYIRRPPYFDKFSMQPEPLKDICGARLLAIFGGTITTDHISPAGAIRRDSAAGKYLESLGVQEEDFNTYGARRGNHEVMVRGTFANIRIKNQMVPGREGGITIHQPDGKQMNIFEAAMRYKTERAPLLIVAGRDYGAGSSRDWAAKGARLLGVRAVIAQSFERIHRSNLAGMGVLPCQFKEGTSAQSLGLNGSERFDLTGIQNGIKPRQDATLAIHRPNGRTEKIPLTLRIDTPIEAEYCAHGGILPYVLRQLLREGAAPHPDRAPP